MLKNFYYIIFLLSCWMLQGCGSNNNGLPNMAETYEYTDTNPFGAYISYHILENSYPRHNVQIKRESFTNTAAWISDTGSVYVNISQKYYVSDEDVDALLDFVYKGNTAFISASEIDSLLLNKLYCKQVFVDEEKSFFPVPLLKTGTQLVPAVRSVSDSIHQYYFYPFANYFSEINDRYCRIVGYNQFKQPNFIAFFWGKGRFYLHCEPRALSNYFLLQKNNYQYLAQPLQVLPEDPEHIYWDDYYNKNNYRETKSSRSIFDILFSGSPLSMAFWLLLLLLLFYILLNGKRRQRIIPVIKPVQNSSVAFAEAIAGLYLKEKNNKNIAEKMISYFNESIRTRYYLNTNIINNDFLDALSRKATVPLEKTTALYVMIQQLADQKDITDKQLLDLNEQIQQFNKYKK